MLTISMVELIVINDTCIVRVHLVGILGQLLNQPGAPFYQTVENHTTPHLKLLFSATVRAQTLLP
jgi:hypothetical protein